MFELSTEAVADHRVIEFLLDEIKRLRGEQEMSQPEPKFLTDASGVLHVVQRTVALGKAEVESLIADYERELPILKEYLAKIESGAVTPPGAAAPSNQTPAAPGAAVDPNQPAATPTTDTPAAPTDGSTASDPAMAATTPTTDSASSEQQPSADPTAAPVANLDGTPVTAPADPTVPAPVVDPTQPQTPAVDPNTLPPLQ